MSMWMSDHPGAGLVRVSLIGPMGIGKTTALRSLCGALMAATDVPNLDRAAHSKEFTTVGAEFGEIDLGEGMRLQLVGSPGQDRFDFVRRWVLNASVGVLLMVDVGDASARTMPRSSCPRSPPWRSNPRCCCSVAVTPANNSRRRSAPPWPIEVAV